MRYPFRFSFYILTLPFDAEYRKSLFNQIHEIVFYGKGGYDFATVYNLPIWLRKYIYHEMVEAYQSEAEAAEGKQNQKKGERPQPNKQVIQKLRQESRFSIQKPR